MSEHDFEPIRGLPGELPAGEKILWQGSPHWLTLAQQAFHLRAVAVYFALMFAWRLIGASSSLSGFLTALKGAVFVTPIALAALGLLCLMAWLTSRSTVYTITTRRLVMRFGIALPKAINIPFGIVDSGAVKRLSQGRGDLALTLKAPNKIAFLNLWPHARPWRLAAPQPTLRGIRDVQSVAGILTNAMAAQAPITLQHAGASAPAYDVGLGGAPSHPAIA